MRTIVYDTEFIEDGSTIDLISIGMVDSAGRTFYAVNRGAVACVQAGGVLMFRPGSHNPHTVYWSGPDAGPDYFVGPAMSAEAAVGVAALLNSVCGEVAPDWVATLPMVPRREESP